MVRALMLVLWMMRVMAVLHASWQSAASHAGAMTFWEEPRGQPLEVLAEVDRRAGLGAARRLERGPALRSSLALEGGVVEGDDEGSALEGVAPSQAAIGPWHTRSTRTPVGRGYPKSLLEAKSRRRRTMARDCSRPRNVEVHRTPFCEQCVAQTVDPDRPWTSFHDRRVP